MIKLTIKADDVVVNKIQETDDFVKFRLGKTSLVERCPYCGALSAKVHSKRTRTVRDRPQYGKQVIVEIEKRRFKCENPECSHRTFGERIGDLRPYQRRTDEFKYFLYSLQKMMPSWAAAKLLAEEYKTRLSQATIYRDFIYIGKLKKKETRASENEVVAVGLDEFLRKRGREFGVALVDLRNGDIIAVEEGKKGESIRRLFEGLDTTKIEVVVIDMWRLARSYINKLLPEAAIVVDRFHVIKEFSQPLNTLMAKVRKRQTDPIIKKLLFKKRRVILKARETLKEEERDYLDFFLSLDEDLKTLWEFKEQLRDIYKYASDIEEARYLLENWIKQARTSGIEELVSLARTFNRWRSEILNYFRFRVTNGKTERAVGRIKQLQRARCGLRNTDTLRCLVSCK